MPAHWPEHAALIYGSAKTVRDGLAYSSATTQQISGSEARPAGRARRVPVTRVTYGDSRSFIEQPVLLLTCAATGPLVVATSFASRGPPPSRSILLVADGASRARCASLTRSASLALDPSAAHQGTFAATRKDMKK